MVFALVYLAISLIVYMAMFRFILRQGKGINTKYQHPEMKEVRPGDPLLVIKFDGPPDSIRTRQPDDLGFSQFLADHPPGPRNHDDS